MTQVSDIQPDIEDIDKWILKESAGCAIDDDKAQVFEYTHGGCVLYANALAKKIVGLWNVPIGNDPRRNASLGAAPFDFDKMQADAEAVKDPVVREGRIAEVKRQHEYCEQVDSQYDAEAWQKVIQLEDIIKRRAMALERAGLVNTNVDHLVPDAAIQKEREQGGDGKVPAEGTIEITIKGTRCVAAQRWPRLKQRQLRSAERFDYEVEIPAGA